MVNDPIGDMIARIKNAAQRGRSKVATPASKMRARVLDAGPPRLFVDQGPEAREERSRDLDPVDAQGRHVRHRRPRRQCGW